MSNKKSDFSDLTKRFDINNLVGSIKSLINPAGGTPEVDPNDAIGLKIAQISVLAQQLKKNADEQSRDFAKLNQLLNGLYQDIERLRHPEGTETTETSSQPVSSDIPPIVTSVNPEVPPEVPPTTIPHKEPEVPPIVEDIAIEENKEEKKFP